MVRIILARLIALPGIALTAAGFVLMAISERIEGQS